MFHLAVWQPEHKGVVSLHLHGCSGSTAFPGGSESRGSSCNAGDPGSVTGLGRSSGEGNGNPLQCSCLENLIDRGAWWATVHEVPKYWTRLNDYHSGSTFRAHQELVDALAGNGRNGEVCAAGPGGLSSNPTVPFASYLAWPGDFTVCGLVSSSVRGVIMVLCALWWPDVGFSTPDNSLWTPTGCLQFNSVLTLSTWVSKLHRLKA